MSHVPVFGAQMCPGTQQDGTRPGPGRMAAGFLRAVGHAAQTDPSSSHHVLEHGGEAAKTPRSTHRNTEMAAKSFGFIWSRPRYAA